MAFLSRTYSLYSSKVSQSFRHLRTVPFLLVGRPFAASQAQVAYKRCSAGMGKKRKFASIERVAEADAFFCPACTQKSLKWPVFSKHLQRCCPDLLPGKAILANDSLEQPLQHASDIKKALDSAIEEEEALRQQLVRSHAAITVAAFTLLDDTTHLRQQLSHEPPAADTDLQREGRCWHANPKRRCSMCEHDEVATGPGGAHAAQGAESHSAGH